MSDTQAQARARRRAWGLWLLALGMLIVGMVFGALTRAIPNTDGASGWLSVAFGLLFLGCATAGALIIARQPANLVGYLFYALGAEGLLTGVTDGYGRYAIATAPGTLPAGYLAAWLSTLLGGALMFSLLVSLFLYFPNGRLPGPRWRNVSRLLGVSALFFALGTLRTRTLENFSVPNVRNPVAIPGAELILGLLELAGILALVLAAGATVLGLIRRLRRARGLERQQLKWFAFAGGIVAATIVIAPYFWFGLPGSTAWPVVFLLGLASVPVAASIAILKHNLYDIDLLINRALVYALLTATLLFIYVVTVVTSGELLRTVTGARSDLITAVSTLAVAALFRPLRERIQRGVDRRFFRRRYDAARTLERFAARLRDELDLDAMALELRDVVQETMQPSHVSLWLRAGAPSAE